MLIIVNILVYLSEVVKFVSCLFKMLVIFEFVSYIFISKDVNFIGVSVLIIDSLIGDKNSLFNVWKRYVKMINSKFVFFVMLCLLLFVFNVVIMRMI